MSNISIFKNIKQAQDGDVIPLDMFLQGIQDGRWVNQIIDYRNDKIDKKSLPYVTVSGEFTHRSIRGLKQASGYICIDIDDVEPNEVKELLCADKYTYACFTSVSGEGIAAIFKINPNKHAESFDGLSEYLFNNYQIIIDPSCRDVCRARFVSYDEDIFINTGAAKFTQYPKAKSMPLKQLPKVVFVQNDFDDIINQITTRNVDIVDSYHDWLRAAFALSDKFGEGGLHYFHQISRIGNKYKAEKCEKQYKACLSHTGSGITIATFYYMAKQAGIATISAQTRLIGIAASHAKKGGRSAKDTAKTLKDLENIPVDYSEPIIQQVFDNNIDFDSEESLVEELEIYLRQNYSLQRNVITRKVENDGQPLETRDLNSIFVHAKKVMDKLSFELMDRVINSDFSKDYNPLQEFIEKHKNMPRPNGIIEQLCRTIVSPMPARYIQLFVTKWLVGIVQSVYEDFSPLMLVLSGTKQNTGKTTWFRNLLPREIRSYYAESKLDAGKDDEILMCTKLIIMDDEMGGKSKKEASRLKELTSKKWFSLREPYGRHNIDLRRLAVLCGTSNDNQLINDPTGNRRIIPIEVTDIDKPLYNSIDKSQMLMEAYWLMASGYTADLVENDIAFLSANTDNFKAVSMERELLEKYFSKPEDSYNATFMTASEIKVYIETRTNQRLNVNKLGHELRNMGIERTGATNKYGYYLFQKTALQ